MAGMKSCAPEIPSKSYDARRVTWAAEREGEFVLLGGEDEVRQFILLETGMMGFDIIPNGIVDCQLVQYGRFEQGLFVCRRLRCIDGTK